MTYSIKLLSQCFTLTPGWRTLSILISGLLLSGCGQLVRTDYRRPELDTPSQWNTPIASLAAAVNPGQTWWSRFNDPALNALLDRIISNNNTLAAAAIAFYKALLESDLVDTNWSPDVTVVASRSSTRSLTSEASSVRSGGISSTVSYELDFWGRMARLRDASTWEAQATEYDRRAAALSLVGNAAKLYWHIAAFNNMIAITQESVVTSERTLGVVGVQRSAGRASEFEEAQSRAALESLRGDLTQLLAQREAARNSLAILSNQSPTHREPELSALTVIAMPVLPSVLPADLLGRRPDLQASEARVRELLEHADATRTGFYPTFSLNALLVTSGASLSTMLKNPVGTLGGSLSLPFLQWNTARLKSRSAVASFDIAVINFRQTFYQALADSQSALAASEQSAEEVARRRGSLDAAKRAETLAEVRFKAGKTSLKDWLDLQRTRQQAALQLEQALYMQYANEATLYLALGGDPRAQNIQSN